MGSRLRRAAPVLWALLLGLVLLGLVLFAIWLTWLIVGSPEEGVRWGPARRWGDLGLALAGLGLFVLALTLLGGGGWSLRRYWQQRQEALELRERQTELDFARLQGELVLALRLRHELLRMQPEEAIVRERLEKALVDYEGTLRSLILARPELGAAAREAIDASLREAKEELERLQSPGG